MVLRLSLAGLALVGLAACVTKPPRADQLKEPPADRLFAFQAKADGDASVVVTRDVGMVFGGCYMAVFIDAKEVAKLDTGERAVFHVPAGDHILGTWNSGSGLCHAGEGKDRRELSTTLKPGDVRKFRITVSSSSGVEFAPTTL